MRTALARRRRRNPLLSRAPGFGRPHLHYRSTDSTNERAKSLAAAGAPSGTVVTAFEQTAGRGRRGRTWVAPAGKALLCSAIVRPLDPERRELLPLIAPLAVCQAAESLSSVECRIKWPNDVLVDGRKVAGVLIEARPDQWAVIGVGLNLTVERRDFPPELQESAGALGAGDPASALGVLCDALGNWLGAPVEEIRLEFDRRRGL
jgi:BirA family biotin operon repressor/biotin-[acetyl-CoA-carboxylase] ligase